MEAAHARRPRGGVRHRGGRDARLRSAAAHRRRSSASSAREPEPERVLRRDRAASPSFQRAARWRDLDAGEFDALFLAGRPRARACASTSARELLQAKVAEFWPLGRPVAAICHGVLVLARAQAAAGVACCTATAPPACPSTWSARAYLSTAWRRGRYYRTYAAYVEDEVQAALAAPGDFERGPRVLSARGTDDDDAPAFVVRDGHYVSARWPGDSLPDRQGAHPHARRETSGGRMIARIQSPSERLQRKQKLAAAYRLFARFNFDEGVAGHITVRDPESADRFWVNPFGSYFGHMRASDLVLVNHEGEIVEGNGPINRAAFAIHSQVHTARPDVMAAAHAHSPARQGLLVADGCSAPLTQDACAFFEDHGLFDDFTGVVSSSTRASASPRRSARTRRPSSPTTACSPSAPPSTRRPGGSSPWSAARRRADRSAAGEVKAIPDPVARQTRDTGRQRHGRLAQLPAALRPHRQGRAGPIGIDALRYQAITKAQGRDPGATLCSAARGWRRPSRASSGCRPDPRCAVRR